MDKQVTKQLDSGSVELKDAERQSIQARIDLHQSILKEYRNRGYQMVLAHAALAIAAARFAVERSGREILAIVLALCIITFFLRSWLLRLKDKSDGHRDDALVLYARLGAGLQRDDEHKDSKKRLWGPLFFVGLLDFCAGNSWGRSEFIHLYRKRNSRG